MEYPREPKPSDFGLTEQEYRLFSIVPKNSEGIPIILGWVGFIAIIVTENHLFFKIVDFFWPLILLFFVPGWLLGFLINKCKIFYVQFRKRNHKRLNLYCQYLDECRRWRRNREELIRLDAERQNLAKREELELIRKQETEKRKQIEHWTYLNGREFEREVYQLLRDKGFNATLTPYSKDGGVDIFIYEDFGKIIVQCKKFSKPIVISIIRDVYGTMKHELADEAWIVTTTGFTLTSRQFVKGKQIRLITIRELLELDKLELTKSIKN